MKRIHRLQEEEQESAVNVADGEIVKKMMPNEMSTFLSTVDKLKISPEGFEPEVTRTVSRARMRF